MIQLSELSVQFGLLSWSFRDISVQIVMLVILPLLLLLSTNLYYLL
jgi:hypothetical protein